MKSRMEQSRRVRAFTLIEMMVVVLIIGALAALVAPRIMHQFEKSKVHTTQAQISLLGNAVKDYYMDLSEYPKSLDDLLKNPGASSKWDGPYLEKDKLPEDAWGEPYDYQLDKGGKSFKIFSKGPDKTAGSADDIKSWE